MVVQCCTILYKVERFHPVCTLPRLFTRCLWIYVCTVIVCLWHLNIIHRTYIHSLPATLWGHLDIFKGHLPATYFFQCLVELSFYRVYSSANQTVACWWLDHSLAFPALWILSIIEIMREIGILPWGQWKSQDSQVWWWEMCQETCGWIPCVYLPTVWKKF